MRLIRHLARRIRKSEAGFTTVTLLGILMLGGVLVASALAAAQPDIRQSQRDADNKQAYAAAEAGLNYYLFRLGRDNNFWARCVPTGTGEPSPHFINQRWNGSGSDPRTWRNLPNGSRSQYTIEVLPANGNTTCSVTNSTATMIDSATGTFRVRVTGRAGGPGSETRTIVATFRRVSFLNFVYFTDYETLPPVTYATSSDQTWASNNCNKYYRDGRPTTGSPSCTNIQFAPGDVQAGPFHTNDDILICATSTSAPTFGRNASDAIEVAAPSPGFRRASGCSTTASPNFLGTWTPGAQRLEMPPSNTALKAIAAPEYQFEGTTRIILSNGGTMTVENPIGSTPVTKSWPANGVIYVDNGSCGSGGYERNQNYDAEQGCGNVYVQGNYSSDLTIGSANDIIVREDIIRQSTSNAMLGLIANNFVRVYHPVDHSNCDDPAANGLRNVRIDAAILALNFSFIVDNWYCADPEGTLTVNGAIAQKYRGTVGTGGTTISTGYLKNYQYDDRLRFRDPPSFLDPVQAGWKVHRQIEQVPPVR